VRYKLLTEELLDEIERLSEDDRSYWLFLSPSEEFKGRWEVSSVDSRFFFDFEEIIGHWRTVSPAGLDEFITAAEEMEYQVVFTDDPTSMIDAYDHLKDPPPFEIESTLENTINGFMPWQVEGFNKLIKDESITSGLFTHDTGLGKSLVAASGLLWHQKYGHPFDIAFVIVKNNNKIDTQRKLKKYANLDSIVIDGTAKKRYEIFIDIESRLQEENLIIITNYEKLREDNDRFIKLVTDRNVLFFFDEIPTKLSNRNTQLYEKTQKLLWKRFESRDEGLAGALPRAKWMRCWGLTATPIENSPEDVFNYVRLMNPPFLGRPKEFYDEYGAHTNALSFKTDRWKNLDKLEGRLEVITHRASKDDPEIAKMFPEVMEDPKLIDWHPKDRTIYDMLANEAAKVLELDDEINILSLIQVLQMLCDIPSMIGDSAKNRKEFEKAFWDDEVFDGPMGSELALKLIETLKKSPTNTTHTKLETLKELLLEKHPNDKALIYMTWASYGFKPMCEKLNEWGISYVTYEGTAKQRQASKDLFRESDIRVFLSSDKGADGIDLPEAAVGINYNLPWTWTKKKQRQGRNNRVDSKLKTLWWYDLLMADSVELRKKEIIDQKHQYHIDLFEGKAVEDTASSRMSKQDLIWILTGVKQQ